MKKFFKLLSLYWYDFTRFRRHSGSLHQTEREQVLAHLIHGYHRIEKGLTMPNFRAGFGKPAERFRVPCSPRKELSSLLSFV